LDFCKNPIWRITWYDKGKTYHYSGFLLTNFDGLIKRIVKLSLPGIKKLKIDEKIAELEQDFQ
jgi:hypothetical protein